MTARAIFRAAGPIRDVQAVLEAAARREQIEREGLLVVPLPRWGDRRRWWVAGNLRDHDGREGGV